ncbi:hypothetical protein [Williamsia sp. 1135]|uniref:hypothetical protein n=1 Tax=Williamsia sp. 1135 TaxID=1889262 RepID=UPI000A10A23B|nr:hypothetical protein [Williamsia sp. 1135]ORM32509.1 hypothetical protein BFL43_15750 [Williamsia sp. 1135]
MDDRVQDLRPDPRQPALLRRAFAVAAAGRLAWGVAALVSPGANLRAAGVPELQTPEVTYLTRVFGARAVAIGVGYLQGDTPARARWQRLGLLVDSLDTVGGLNALRSIDDAPRRRAAVLLVAITGTYTALGIAGSVHALLSDRH